MHVRLEERQKEGMGLSRGTEILLGKERGGQFGIGFRAAQKHIGLFDKERSCQHSTAQSLSEHFHSRPQPQGAVPVFYFHTRRNLKRIEGKPRPSLGVQRSIDIERELPESPPGSHSVNHHSRNAPACHFFKISCTFASKSFSSMKYGTGGLPPSK